jgi:hypothetical protein
MGGELPSLRSLLALNSTRPPFDSEDTLDQKSLTGSIFQIQGWVELHAIVERTSRVGFDSRVIRS